MPYVAGAKKTHLRFAKNLNKVDSANPKTYELMLSASWLSSPKMKCVNQRQIKEIIIPTRFTIRKYADCLAMFT
jgi:hypothetical protein